ncbi:MAG: hypothetical protein KAH44_00885, partial [Oricola sp.]|nr:hypothetical protein [Oricola sp.]
MNEDIAPVRVVENPTQETFVKEIAPQAEPVLLKGLVRDWPSVGAGRSGDETLVRYLMGYY